MDKIGYGEGSVAARLFAMDGSRVWIKYRIGRNVIRAPKGWDLGPSGLFPIEQSTEPPEKLCLSNTKLWDNSLCRISDTVTRKVVFQLPPQFGTPIDFKWNGQYLVARSEEHTSELQSLV